MSPNWRNLLVLPGKHDASGVSVFLVFSFCFYYYTLTSGLRLDDMSSAWPTVVQILISFTLAYSRIAMITRLCFFHTNYSRNSMARTSLGPWKFVRDIGSSSH